MLRKHLSQYQDHELAAEIARHVNDKVPESKRLDYKAAPSLDSAKGKREAAKDISSFANEIGGYVIYGIPEERQPLPDGTKSAIPTKPYGIDPVPGLEARLEDIYVESICPRLPDLQIRKIGTEYEGKVVYVVWHSESWMAPHMVQAGDNRYYRRGLLRAVMMDEHEVRDKYTQARQQLDSARQFLESPELNFYGEVFPGRKMHFASCPLMLLPDRVDFSSGQMRQWLTEGAAISFSQPYRWTASREGVSAGRERETYDGEAGGEWYCELHRNGAISYWEDTPIWYPNAPAGSGEEQNLIDMEQVLNRCEVCIEFCGHFYQQIGYYQPVALRLSVMPCTGLGFYFHRRWQVKADAAVAKLAVRGAVLQIDRLASAAQMISEPEAVRETIATAIHHAFRKW